MLSILSKCVSRVLCKASDGILAPRCVFCSRFSGVLQVLMCFMRAEGF